MSLVVLGVDPHKQSHTASALAVGSTSRWPPSGSRPAPPATNSC